MPRRWVGFREWNGLKCTQYLAGSGRPLLLFENHSDSIQWCWEWKLLWGPAFISCGHWVSGGDQELRTRGEAPLLFNATHLRDQISCQQRLSSWWCPWPGTELLDLWTPSALPCSSPLVTGMTRKVVAPTCSRWPPELSHHPGNNALVRLAQAAREPPPCSACKSCQGNSQARKNRFVDVFRVSLLIRMWNKARWRTEKEIILMVVSGWCLWQSTDSFSHSYSYGPFCFI